MPEAKRYWNADPHAHSTASDGVKTWREQAERAKKVGLDLYGRTDHDVSAVRGDRQDGEPDYLVGREATSRDGHMLVYAPNGTRLVDFPIARRAEEIVRRANGEGLVVGFAHFGFLVPPGSGSVHEARRIRDKGLRIDFIEAGHPNLSPKGRKRAERLAIEIGAAVTGGGDDHIGNMGGSFTTEFPRVTNDPQEDFFTAVREKKTRIKDPDPTIEGVLLPRDVRIHRIIQSLFNADSTIKISRAHRFAFSFFRGIIERALWELTEGKHYGK